jgi:hypothetical protein
MFKALHKKIDDAKESIIKHICNEINYLRQSIMTNCFEASQEKYTIEVQRQTIELLTNALQDKYDRGLLVVSDKHNVFIPFVIKDGKMLTDGKIKSVNIYWESGQAPDIEICH